MGRNDKVFEVNNLKHKCVGSSSFCIFSIENRNTFNDIVFEGFIFAESGLYFSSMQEKSKRWVKTELFSSALPILNWTEELLKILYYYSERVPNATIEVSEVRKLFLLYTYIFKSLITWKFGFPELIFSKWISSELQMNLEKLIGHLPLKVNRY